MRRKRRERAGRLLRAAVIAASFAYSTSARAADTRLGAATVVYRTRELESDRCPTEAEFMSWVRAALAAEPTDANTTATRIDVSLEATPKGGVGTLTSL